MKIPLHTYIHTHTQILNYSFFIPPFLSLNTTYANLETLNNFLPLASLLTHLIRPSEILATLHPKCGSKMPSFLVYEPNFIHPSSPLILASDAGSLTAHSALPFASLQFLPFKNLRNDFKYQLEDVNFLKISHCYGKRVIPA